MAELEKPKPAVRRKNAHRSPSSACKTPAEVFDENAVPDVSDLHALLVEPSRPATVSAGNTLNAVDDEVPAVESLCLSEVIEPEFIDDAAECESSTIREVEIATETAAPAVVSSVILDTTVNEEAVAYPDLSDMQVVSTSTQQVVQVTETPSAGLLKSPRITSHTVPTTNTTTVVSAYGELSNTITAASERTLPLAVALQPLSNAERQHIYRNTQLELVQPLVNKFIQFCSWSREAHPFFILLQNYLKYLNKVDEARIQLDALKKDYESCRNSLWKTLDKSVTGSSRCADGKQVSTTHHFRQSVIDDNSHKKLVHASESIRSLIVGDGCFVKYTCQLSRTQIEAFMARLKSQALLLSRVVQSMPVTVLPQESDRRTDKEELLNCIAILFATQRVPVPGGNKRFLNNCRYWLCCLVGVLLRSASPVDHMYIMNEVLRCPSDVCKWAGRFIQTCIPRKSLFACADPATDLFIAQLYCLYIPIVARDDMLAKLKLKDAAASSSLQRRPAATGAVTFGGTAAAQARSVRDSVLSTGDDWQMVSADTNESVSLDYETILPLSESDMLSLLSQFRFDELFDAVYDVQQFAAPTARDADVLRLVVFTHNLVRVIETGLAARNATGNYHHFTRRNAQLVRQPVMCLHACVMSFLQSRATTAAAALPCGLLVEYEEVILLAVRVLLRYPADGSVQFLVGLPYETLTLQAQLRLWCIMTTCGTAPDDTMQPALNSYASKRGGDAPISHELVRLEQLIETKLGGSANALFLLIAFSDLGNALRFDAVDISSSSSSNAAENELKRSLLLDITYHLFYISCLSPTLREKLSKNGRDLLAALARRHLWLVSYFLELIPEYIGKIGGVAVSIVQELPFNLWRPQASDITLLCTWLEDDLRVALVSMQDLPQQQKVLKKSKNTEKVREAERQQQITFAACIRHLMARKILAQLNYGYEDNSDELALPQSFHRQIALSMVRAHLRNEKHLALSKNKTSMFSSLLSSAVGSLSVMSVGGSGTLKRGADSAAAQLISTANSNVDNNITDYASDYTTWCWQMLTFRLKLHPLLQTRTMLKTLNSNIVTGDAAENSSFDDIEFQKALTERRDRLVCALALCIAPNYAYSSSAVLERSFELLHLVVVDANMAFFVLVALHQLIPLFLPNRQFAYLMQDSRFCQLVRCVLEQFPISINNDVRNRRPKQQSSSATTNGGVTMSDSVWQGIGAAAATISTTLTGVAAVAATSEDDDEEIVDQRCAMVVHQLLACRDGPNFKPAMVAWLHIIACAEPPLRFWVNSNALVMLNSVASVALAFEQHETVIAELRTMFMQIFQQGSNNGGSGRGVMSSLVSWAVAGQDRANSADWASSEATLQRYPAYSLFALQAELSSSNNVPMEVQQQLVRALSVNNNKSSAAVTADAALKKVLSNMKISNITLEQLPMVRWARALLVVKVSEPSFVLFAQHFFELFLLSPTEPTTNEAGGRRSMGDVVFLSKSLSPLAKALKQKLQTATEYQFQQLSFMQQQSAEPAAAAKQQQPGWPVELHRRLYHLYRAMTLWLDEPRVHDVMSSVLTLPADYLPSMLERCRRGPFYPWRDYLPCALMQLNVHRLAECWQGPNFFRSTSKPAADVGQRRASPAHTATTAAAATNASVSAVLGLPRALPPPYLPAFLSTPAQPSGRGGGGGGSNQVASIIMSAEESSYLFSDANKLLDAFRRNFSSIERVARDEFERRSLLVSLDVDYLELVKVLWQNADASTTLTKQCGTRCVGAAVMQVQFKESKRNEVAWTRARQNRQQWQQHVDEFAESSNNDEDAEQHSSDAAEKPHVNDAAAQAFILAVVQTETLASELLRRCTADHSQQQALSSAGIQLFYLVLSFVKEHTVQYEPAATFLQSTLNLLGQYFISSAADQQLMLIELLLRTCDEMSGTSPAFKQHYASLLVECFSPLSYCTTTGAVDGGGSFEENASAFIQLYRRLSEAWQERKAPAGIIYQFLSRFSRAYTTTTANTNSGGGGTLQRQQQRSSVGLAATAGGVSLSPIIAFFTLPSLSEKRHELMQTIVQTFTCGIRGAALEVRTAQSAVKSPEKTSAGRPVENAVEKLAAETDDEKVRLLALQHFLSFVKVDTLHALFLVLEKCYHAHQILPAQLESVCAVIVRSNNNSSVVNGQHQRNSVALDDVIDRGGYSPMIVDASQLAVFLARYFSIKRRHYWHSVSKRQQRRSDVEANSATGPLTGYVHHLQAYIPVLVTGSNCLLKALAVNLLVAQAQQQQQQRQELQLYTHLFAALVLPLSNGDVMGFETVMEDAGGGGGAAAAVGSPSLSSSTSMANFMLSSRMISSSADDAGRKAATTGLVRLQHSQSLSDTGAITSNMSKEQLDFPWTDARRDEVGLLLRRFVEFFNTMCALGNTGNADVGVASPRLAERVQNESKTKSYADCAELIWHVMICPLVQLWFLLQPSSSSSSATNNSSKQFSIWADQQYYSPLLSALTKLEAWSFWWPSDNRVWHMLTFMIGCSNMSTTNVWIDTIICFMPTEIAKFALRVFVRMPLPLEIQKHIGIDGVNSSNRSLYPSANMKNDETSFVASCYYVLSMYCFRLDVLPQNERSTFLMHNLAMCTFKLNKLPPPPPNSAQQQQQFHFWAALVDTNAYKLVCSMLVAEGQKSCSSKVADHQQQQQQQQQQQHHQPSLFAELEHWPSIELFLQLAGACYTDMNFNDFMPLLRLVGNNNGGSGDRVRAVQADVLAKRTVFMQYRAALLQQQVELCFATTYNNSTENTKDKLRDLLLATLASIEAVCMTTTYVKQANDVVLENVAEMQCAQMRELTSELLHVLINCKYAGSNGGDGDTMAARACMEFVLETVRSFWRRTPSDVALSQQRPLLLPFINATCHVVASLERMSQVLEWCLEAFWAHAQFPSSLLLDPVHGFLSTAPAQQQQQQQRESLSSDYDVVVATAAATNSTFRFGNIQQIILPLLQNALELPELARQEFLLAARKQRAYLLLHAYAEHRLFYAAQRTTAAASAETLGAQILLLQEMAQVLNFTSTSSSKSEEPLLKPTAADEMKVMTLIAAFLKISCQIVEGRREVVSQWRDAVFSCIASVVEQLHVLCGDSSNSAFMGFIGSAFKQKPAYSKRFKLYVRHAACMLAAVIQPTHISNKLCNQVNEVFNSMRNKKEYLQSIPELLLVMDRAATNIAALKKCDSPAERLRVARQAVVQHLELTLMAAKLGSAQSGTASMSRNSSSNAAGDNLLAQALNFALFEVLMFKSVRT